MPDSRLIKYDAACKALAAARSVDEVKDLLDKAAALKAYARQAKNKQLEIDAAEIRIRAERRLGEMLKESDKNKGGRPNKKPVDSDDRLPTYEEIGITKDLASRAQQLADIPEDVFEQTLAEPREEQAAVTSRTMTRLKEQSDSVRNNGNGKNARNEDIEHCPTCGQPYPPHLRIAPADRRDEMLIIEVEP